MWTSRLFYLVGCWVLILGAAQIVPLTVALILGEQGPADAFMASLFLSTLIGGAFFLGFRSSKPVRIRKLTVLLPIIGGVCLAVVAGLPLFFLFPEQGAMAAFYDGMSMMTTNGSSAYEGSVERYRSAVLWRALASWIGGFMAVVATLSLLSAINSGGLQIRRSPLPFGDSETSYPRLYAGAKTLFPLYAILTALGCLALLAARIPVLDGVILSMSAVSTTGVSSREAAMLAGFWPQLITAILMLLGMTGWDVHYARVKHKRLHRSSDPELAVLLALILVAAAALFLLGDSHAIANLWQTAYAAISAVSTTGTMPPGYEATYSNGEVIGIVLLSLAAVGGAVVGTGGGIKAMRLIVVARLGWSEVERLAHPNGVRSIRFGGEKVTDPDIAAVWLLLGGFIMFLTLGCLALAVLGIDPESAMMMAFTSLTLSGPLIGVADPYFIGFVGLRDIDYGVLSALMLVGRVEASIALALVARAIWRG